MGYGPDCRSNCKRNFSEIELFRDSNYSSIVIQTTRRLKSQKGLASTPLDNLFTSPIWCGEHAGTFSVGIRVIFSFDFSRDFSSDFSLDFSSDSWVVSRMVFQMIFQMVSRMNFRAISRTNFRMISRAIFQSISWAISPVVSKICRSNWLHNPGKFTENFLRNKLENLNNEIWRSSFGSNCESNEVR